MYDSPIFLDCCGLVRQALRDMKVHTHATNPKPQTPNPKPQTPNPKPQTPNPKSLPTPPQDELGFTTGPWNQACVTL